jgi:hypothetical protein
MGNICRRIAENRTMLVSPTISRGIAGQRKGKFFSSGGISVPSAHIDRALFAPHPAARASPARPVLCASSLRGACRSAIVESILAPMSPAAGPLSDRVKSRWPTLSEPNMSYVLSPFLVDLEGLRKAVGSRDESLIAAVVAAKP